REGRAWSADSTAHGLLEVELEPAVPSLEQLWAAKASILVRGPSGRHAKCRVQMFARAGEAPSFDRQLPPVALPLSSDKWALHFERYIKKDKDAQHAYDDAQICEVAFSADELGVFRLHCERAFTPLRWTIRRDSSGFIACLRDDAGGGVPFI